MYFRGLYFSKMTSSKNSDFEGNYNSYFLQVIESLPLGVLLFNGEGKITFLNNNFLDFCDYYKIEINPSNTINIFHEDLFNEYSFIEHFQKLRLGYSFEKEIEGLSTFSLRKIKIILKGIPLYSENNFDGGILVLSDLKVGGSNEQNDESLDLRWKEILKSTVDLVLITNIHGRIKYSFGRKIKRIFSQISPFEQNNIENLFSSDTKQLIKEKINLVKEDLTSQTFNLLLTINKRSHEYECEIDPLLNENKDIELLFFKFRDIRKYIKQQNLLESKLQELQINNALLAQTVNPAIEFDSNGKIIAFTQPLIEYLGFTAENLLGTNFTSLFSIDDPDYLEKILNELAINNSTERWFHIKTALGKEEIFSGVFKIPQHKTNSIIITFYNISEKLKLEANVLQLEENLEQLTDHSGLFFFTADISGLILFANNKFKNLFKISGTKITSVNINSVIDYSAIEEKTLDEISLSSHEKKEVEIPVILNENKKILLNGSVSKINDNHGNQIYLGVFRNLSNGKIVSQELEYVSELFAKLEEGIAIEKDHQIIFANDAFIKLFGYGRTEDLIGRSFLEMVDVADIKRIAEYIDLIKRKIDSPRKFEFIGQRANKQTISCSTSVSEFEWHEKNYIVFLVNDNSDKKRSVQALSESEEKYRGLIENLDDFFFVFERFVGQLKPSFFTENIRKITGFTQSEMLKDSKLFLKITYPEDVPFVKQKVIELFKSRIKNSTEFEYRIINRYGNIIWIRSKINVVRDSKGYIIKLYGITGDISIRKKAEEDLKTSKEKLVKLNEAKDRFLSIVSHDLRTPFSSILGFTELLLNEEGLSETEQKTYIRFIQESSHNMLSLVNSLLNWNRLQSGRIDFEPEKIMIYPIIQSSINSLTGAAIQKGIKIISNVPEQLHVFVDDGLILQVFNNLISNAIKFTDRGGMISVSAKPSKQMRFIEFCIEDTGVGMMPEEIKKLFSIESKFTKDGTSGERGSGLGLTIVHDIILKHGGSIWVESVLRKGSAFKFTLPVASAVILLVDDNKTDRLLYSKILNNITPDYTVETASNGSEALSKIRKSTPALVITDHSMPEMTGIQLVQEIQKLGNEAPPTMILSEDIDKTAIHDYGLLGIDYIFQKPVNLADFKHAVEQTIRKGLLGE